MTAAGTADNSVRRISRSYEARGMLAHVVSYDNADIATGNLRNEVAFEYNGFGQLTGELQQPLPGRGYVPGRVSYAYADGSANQIRPTSLTYPNGRQIGYGYFDLDDTYSRISQIEDRFGRAPVR